MTAWGVATGADGRLLGAPLFPVGPVLNKRLQESPALFSPALCTRSTCGTGCWEASSTRTSGLEKARVSALSPHSMRESGRGLRIFLAEPFHF